MIEGLERLYCTDCSKITIIPRIKGLLHLYCDGCSNLTKLPEIEELEELDCKNCSKLVEIPDSLASLKNVNCSQCRRLIKIPGTLRGSDKRLILRSDGCVWLNDKNNKKYDENIVKLKILQRWAKRMLLVKRLIRLIPQLMPLYYDPLAKGGYFHKKNMMMFIKQIR